jgi:Reverse transcriptase (RNA-dependent DNA polymerase)
VDISDKIPNPPLISVPYPKGPRELRSLSYGTAPAPKRLARELKSLQSSNIHVAYINRQIKPDNENEFTMLSAAFNSIAGFDDGSDTPKNYKYVLGHKNQAKWWESMNNEFHAMESKGVWKIVPLSSMPHGRKLVGNRWVYTEKDDGTYRSRTVAQGFSQVPEFTDSHAPVMTDLAFRIALIIRLLRKQRTGQFDIETAFLYSELDEKIYMRLPNGYVKYMLEVHYVKIDPSTHVLLLKKAIYG